MPTHARQRLVKEERDRQPLDSPIGGDVVMEISERLADAGIRQTGEPARLALFGRGEMRIAAGRRLK